jgi:hypothetical protein
VTRAVILGALIGAAVGLWWETERGVLNLTFEDMLNPEDWVGWDGVPRR